MVVVTQPSSKKISSQTILRETPKWWPQHYHSSISPQSIKAWFPLGDKYDEQE